MNETQVTIIGNAVEDPIRRQTRNNEPYVTLRLASTVRRFDPSSQQYVDAGTNFVTVVAFRQLALNVADSVTKGQPLVVTGRLRINQWQNGERSGTSVEVDAQSVGHDLSRGVGRFNRVRPGQDSGSFPAQAPVGPSTRTPDAPAAAMSVTGEAGQGVDSGPLVPVYDESEGYEPEPPEEEYAEEEPFAVGA